MSKRIVIAVIGTHGDVQPFVALALTLQRRGFDPLICTTDDFQEFVTAHGIDFHSVGSDMQALLRQSQMDDGTRRRFLLYAPGLLREGQKMLKEAGKRVWEAAQDASLLVFASTTTFCIDMAEALGIPAIMTAFQPLNPTDEFPYFQYEFDPVQPWLFRFNREPFATVPSIDPMLNKLSYFVQRAHQTFYDLPRDRLRRTLLGLRAKKRGGFYTNTRGEPVTTLHAYSPSISPAPGDWPANNVITGFWRLDDRSGWEPSPEFAAFLVAGDAPIYLGFGSMPFGAQRNTEIIAKALKTWGGRAVIGKGWGGIREDMLPDSVFVVDRAPHSLLFNHVQAVVHHGGAGTTHTGLLAGKPTFIVPQFFDQPYWGKLVYELGCGPAPVRLKKLTPQILAAALEDLATTPSYQKCAETLRDKLQLEDGTNRAVDVIEETLGEHSAHARMQLEYSEAAL
ncbi:MAG TPA: glycosyltransferase [Devosia sp.]|nr:glycosyltransferase [Devosia sp.]